MRVLAGLALLLGLIGPVTARAHPIQFGVARVSEHAGGSVDLSLRFSGSEAAPAPVLRLEVTGCEPAGPVRVEVEGNGSRRQQRVTCEGGLAGRAVRVAGLEERAEQVAVVVRRADGSEEHHLIDAEQPSLDITARAGGWATFLRHHRLGVEHILFGFDHLLFVVVLMLLAGGGRSLLMTLTAFTLGHSVTLGLSALGFVRLAPGPIEALIALSIVLVARELALVDGGPPGQARLGSRLYHPATAAALFGLLHGLGFAGALQQTGLPEGQVTAALFGFNVGVEVGQIAFVAALVSVAHLLRRYHAPLRRLAPRLIGGIAAYWSIERVAAIVSVG